MTQISKIIILYELIIYLLYTLNITKSIVPLLSWIILPHLFISFVTISVPCENEDYTIMFRTGIFLFKILLLMLLLSYSHNFSSKNLLLGILFLLCYVLISDINSEYLCQFKPEHFILPSFLSIFTYYLLWNCKK